ncbi:MAG TPA: hypothetical protein VN753_12485 [Terracidiphilus sp.]|nr:hypothetical protein [Terracidiphilus sp.]
MDRFRGLRAAFALCVPLVIGNLAGLSIAGWAALGGFEAILADTGGPYRDRLAKPCHSLVRRRVRPFHRQYRRTQRHPGSPPKARLLLLLELSRRPRPAVRYR